MNIFIDTNIIYGDCFFQKPFNKELLQIAKEKAITLNISRVVIQELRVQYEKELKRINRDIGKYNHDITRFKIPQTPIPPIDYTGQLHAFDTFFVSLSEEKAINIIETEDDLTNEILEKLFSDKKPFKNGKDGFKDSVIWIMYARIAEQLADEEVYFLTDNTKDFCSDENKSKIHDDLKTDSEKFVVYNSTDEFLKDISADLKLIPSKFEDYIINLNIDEDYLINKLNKLIGEIESHAFPLIEQYEMVELFPDEYNESLAGERVEAHNIVIHDVIDIDYTIIHNKAIIKAKAFISCDIDGYLYNSYRDSGDPDERYIGGGELFFYLDFTAEVMEGKDPFDFVFTKLTLDN